VGNLYALEEVMILAKLQALFLLLQLMIIAIILMAPIMQGMQQSYLKQ